MKQQKRPEREHTPYQQKLLDPRWQKRRLEILERDKWLCHKCGNNQSTLHVHHRYYEGRKEPWDYPATAFITLCSTCHEEETITRPYAEEILLQVLRVKGFDTQSMQCLADALESWQFLEFVDEELGRLMNITMVKWALSDKDFQQSMLAEFKAARKKD